MNLLICWTLNYQIQFTSTITVKLFTHESSSYLKKKSHLNDFQIINLFQHYPFYELAQRLFIFWELNVLYNIVYFLRKISHIFNTLIKQTLNLKNLLSISTITTDWKVKIINVRVNFKCTFNDVNDTGNILWWYNKTILKHWWVINVFYSCELCVAQ